MRPRTLSAAFCSATLAATLAGATAAHSATAHSATAPSSAVPQARTAAVTATTAPRYDHVVVVIFENTNYSTIKSGAPLLRLQR